MSFEQRLSNIKSKISLESQVEKYTSLCRLDETDSHCLCKLDETNNHCLKANCPLCGSLEKTFNISVPKQVFYCFNCHKGGDLISFLNLKLNLSPNDILDRLEKEIACKEFKIEDE
jgi:DNA primase